MEGAARGYRLTAPAEVGGCLHSGASSEKSAGALFIVVVKEASRGETREREGEESGTTLSVSPGGMSAGIK